MMAYDLESDGGGGGTLADILRQVAPAPAPAPTAAPAPAPAEWGGYLNQDIVNQLLQQYGQDAVLGGDHLTAALNPLSGVKINNEQWKPMEEAWKQTYMAGADAYRPAATFSGGDTEVWSTPTWEDFLNNGSGATYSDGHGGTYSVKSYDAAGNPIIQYGDNSGGGWENPTGTKRDRVQPTYTLNPDGTATPISANGSYKPSGWVDYGRDLAKWAAVMATAGFGGAAMAGAGAGAEAGAVGAGLGTSGSAATGNMALLESALGTTGYGASSATGTLGSLGGGVGGLSGMDLAADAALGSGNNMWTAGGSLGGSAGGTAGSNAGNIFGEGAFEPSWEGAGQWLGQQATDPSNYTKLLDMYSQYAGGGAGGGGMSASASSPGFRAPDRTAQIQAEALRKQQNMAQQSFMPTWSGGK